MLALKVKIINPDEILFEGEAEYVMAPSSRGMLGIMPYHTSMFAALVKGELILKASQVRTIALESGILRVKNDEVLILIEKPV